MEEKDETKGPRTEGPSQDSPDSCSVTRVARKAPRTACFPGDTLSAGPLKTWRGVTKIREQLGVSVLSPHLPPCLTFSSVSTPVPSPQLFSFVLFPLSLPHSFLLDATVYFLR